MKSFELVPHPEYPSFDFKVTLKPSFRCNQNCWFCTEYDNSSDQWSMDDCNRVLDKLEGVMEPYDSIFIYFYGGEPTLSKHYEYLHHELITRFRGKKMFLQTQTNLSMPMGRWTEFLESLDLGPRHKLDISPSYHLGKQEIKHFIEKLYLIHRHDALGLIFTSTDFINEEQFMHEFTELLFHFPGYVKLKFTEIGSGVSESPEAKKYPKTDKLKSFEYNYFITKYPWMRVYFEEGFNFRIDGTRVLNYSEVKAHDHHKQFRLMKCECGTKNLVIDHNLKMYRCNDDFYNNIGVQDITEPLDIKNKYCLNNACYDGLEFKKWK